MNDVETRFGSVTEKGYLAYSRAESSRHPSVSEGFTVDGKPLEMRQRIGEELDEPTIN
jgi:hypothetical protein